MRVGELIEKLKVLDPNLLVVVDHDDYGDYVEASGPKVLAAYPVKEDMVRLGVWSIQTTYELSTRKVRDDGINIVHIGQG